MAAALFEPNVFIGGGGFGSFALLALFDARRKERAIADGTGLAAPSLLVVTGRRIYAFDATMLRWWDLPRIVGEWDRSEVTATAVPVRGPEYARQSRTAPPGRWPALRIEEAAGRLLAEVQPYGWRAAHKELFQVLTGAPGWPSGSGHPEDTGLKRWRLVPSVALVAAVIGWRAAGMEGTTTDRVLFVTIISAFILGPLLWAILRRD